MDKFETIKQSILNKLGSELSENLHYHGREHTEDVLNAAITIAKSEGVTEHELFLIKLAALYHDTGFLTVHRGHEEQSCNVAKETLPEYGLTPEDIKIVCDMIMATKLPQEPSDKLSMIICDADLDYLGRNDFFIIGQTLFDEMKDFGFIKDEKDWNRLQLQFLEGHSYFTQTSMKTRNEKKLQHLETIRKIVEGYDKEAN